jgi:hypothetical protein
MTLVRVLMLTAIGVAVGAALWGAYTWWRDRRIETQASARFVQRFRDSKDSRGD